MKRQIEVYEGVLDEDVLDEDGSMYRSGYAIRGTSRKHDSYDTDFIEDILSGFRDKKIRFTIEVIE